MADEFQCNGCDHNCVAANGTCDYTEDEGVAAIQELLGYFGLKHIEPEETSRENWKKFTPVEKLKTQLTYAGLFHKRPLEEEEDENNDS